VGTDVTGVGTARFSLAAAGYGTDKAIFGYGQTGSYYSMTNLVSNVGVVSTDVTGVGYARSNLAAAGYGGDKAIFGYGQSSLTTYFRLNNLVSNVGVVATDTTGVGQNRAYLAAAGYGGDKAIFGFGGFYNNMTFSDVYLNNTNLVSNAGVVAAEVNYIGTGRYSPAAAGFSS
jgi:hypothetical protein